MLWKKIKEKRYGGIGEVGVARIGKEGLRAETKSFKEPQERASEVAWVGKSVVCLGQQASRVMGTQQVG